MFESLWFDSDTLKQKGMLIGTTNIGRTETFFFSANNQEYVLKHYYRGGLLRFLVKNHYVYTAQDRTRPFIEWRMLSDLYQQGFAVPRPIAACYTLRGSCYTGSLITSSCRPAIPLSEFLGISTMNSDLWFDLGKLIRDVHQKGVDLPDLNASNILYDSKPRKFWFIDFDSTKVYASGLSERTCQANLNRLKRSFEKIASNTPLGNEFHYSLECFTALREGYDIGS